MEIGGTPSGSVLETFIQPVAEKAERPRPESATELRDSARIAELQRQDTFIRRYAESRALAVGTPATYQLVLGPDGKRYAVSGSVDLRAYQTPGDPQATVREARYIQRIAQSGPSLSPADRSAAVEARRLEWEAQRELLNAETSRRGIYTSRGRLMDAAAATDGIMLTA
ncbi:MAG TPA: putative metalloprotease CJM1_0395 family protein [Candidatus Ozemobacteraceae bacterium]|nr:putative metalloprotease CJM1_0395 family protein [Candidatus Ozemobacteraceae bacterium]